MNNKFFFKKINDKLTVRLVKWYECGILGCGPNSVPWIDLSNYIDLPDNANQISDEISVLSLDFPQLSGGFSSIVPYEINNQHSPPYYIYHLERYMPLDIRSRMTTKWDIDNWLFDNICDKIWSACISVKTHNLNPWINKNSKTCLWITDKFPLLKSWIESLTMFSEIGRVMIFRNNSNHQVLAHRDDIFSPHSNHFINFQFNKVRPAYVYDEVEKKKIYITSRIYMFNEHDIHGVDAEEQQDFTVRVDGKFTEDFCNMIGLPNGIVWDYTCRTGTAVENLEFHEYTE